jgi:hypothetical protein
LVGSITEPAEAVPNTALGTFFCLIANMPVRYNGRKNYQMLMVNDDCNLLLKLAKS